MKYRQILLISVLVIFVIALNSGKAWTQFEPPQDIEITEAVRNELVSDNTVPESIEVYSDAGLVTLTGKVNNILAKERAERLAENVTGVIMVNNRIEVVVPKKISDTDIRKGILLALKANPATEAYKTGIDVSNGIVTLTGHVNSLQEKSLVESISKGVMGVRDVNNQLIVHIGSRPDEEIALEIRAALQWDALVNSDHLRVNVQNGNVKLIGTVASVTEKRRAIQNASVAGVKSVDATTLDVARWVSDETRIKERINITDDGIRKAIKKRLMLDPLVDRLKVKVDVADGIATLTGTVESLLAKRSAEDAARTVMGVLRVNNRLKVDPPGDFTDAQVKTEVQRALIRDPYVSSYEISVKVEDGIVTLQGVVDTPAEKAMAANLISGVKGVTGINNRLKVEDMQELSPDKLIL